MFFNNLTTVYALRPKNEKEAGNHPVTETESRSEPFEQNRWIVCRQCLQRLTRSSERIQVNGTHSHTFANPTGMVFEIGCFRMVSGLQFIGPPSYEFPWFAGHSWQIVICRSCQTHVGWFFQSSASGQFYGLILDRLQEIDVND